MVKTEDIILFEKAYTGELSKDQNKGFTERLARDEEFKSNFEKYKEIVVAIKQQQNYEDLMVVLNESYKTKDWSVSTEEIQQVKKPVVHWLITVALVIVAVVATFFIMRSQYGSATISDGEVEVPVEERAETEPQKNESTGSTLEDGNEQADPSEENPAVEDEKNDRNPTAFMISQNGYFLTAYEPISEARSLRLRQNDTIDYRADIVLYDPVLDVAVLRLSDGQWDASVRLPYRLATTQAFANTEVMVVGRSAELSSAIGNINALESEGSFKHYDVAIENGDRFNGGPVISKNGNVVAMVSGAQGSTVSFVKSTHLVGLLARSANEAGMEGYLPAADNRLAGLERPAQEERVAPFVLEVIRFY